MTGLLHIKKAINNLNPEEVRQLTNRSFRIGIRAGKPEGYARIENFLLAGLSPERRRQSSAYLGRDLDPASADVVLYDETAATPPGSFVLHTGYEQQVVKDVLDRNCDLAVPLARAFPPFRKSFVESAIARTSRENTLFAMTTALPDVIPNFIEIPWAIAEFASDTAFLTMNQLRMAFLIAAASDREVGYRQQKSEVAAVIAGAFGWRAIARELVGKIPFGGGLIGKAAVAYAGTKVVGISLDHLYSVGYNFTKQERETLYVDALKQGRKVATDILQHLRPKTAAKYAQRALSRVPMVYPRGDVE